jgi:hypothetical protein
MLLQRSGRTIYRATQQQSCTKVQKSNAKHGQLRVTLSPKPPPSPVTLVSRPLVSTPVIKRRAAAKMVYSRAERVFVLEDYFASKSFAAVRKIFITAYPYKEVPNMTIHLLEIKLRDTRSACLCRELVGRQNSWNYDRSDFKQCDCRNSILPLVKSICAWRGWCVVVTVAF